MANKLSDLEIREVSLVDRPANAEHGIPRARIALFKRDDEEVDKAAAGVKFVIGFSRGSNGSEVQSVIFEKDKWTVATAKSWLKAHDFSGLDVDETGESFRFRQKDPDKFVRFRTISPSASGKLGKTKKFDEAKVRKYGETVLKGMCLYPPLGTSDQPKAQTFEEVYSRLEAQEEFEEMGEEFQEKLSALQQAAWSIIADTSVVDKQTSINAAVEAFVASVKQGLSEAGEPYHKNDDKGANNMTLEEIEKRVTELETENQTLKRENDLVIKMSKKERKLYASMSEEKRKAFMAGDAKQRENLLGEAAEEQKRKALEDSMDEATKSAYAKAGPAEKKEILVTCAKAKAKAKGDDEEGDDEEELEEEKRKALTRKAAETADRLTKAEAELAAIQKRDRLEHFTKVAETALPNTAGSPAEKGEMLMKLAANTGGEDSGDFKKLLDTLKRADKATEARFHEIGKAGIPVPAGEEALIAKATEIAKRDGTSQEVAMSKALMENPELYKEYERQKRGALAAR